MSSSNTHLYSPMPDPTPIVFVIDDDVSVRESLELLVRYEGWQAETFASAAEFLPDHESLSQAA